MYIMVFEFIVICCLFIILIDKFNEINRLETEIYNNMIEREKENE